MRNPVWIHRVEGYNVISNVGCDKPLPQLQYMLIVSEVLSTEASYVWTMPPDGRFWNQIAYILCSQRWRSSIQTAKTRLEADCGSDHKLLIVKFRLKLKKVGKTIQVWPKSNPLQLYSGSDKQIQGNRSDRLPEELWTEVHDIVQGAWIKTIPVKKECKKMAVWGDLTNSCKKKRSKKQRRKGKINPLESRFQRRGRRDKKAYLSEQCKEIEENNGMKRQDIFKEN